jgi:predicted phosphoadenosine phosphosulfate sulfurtransferase
MEFEEFILDFGQWFAGDKKTACLVGIRADESLNRFRTIASDTKEQYRDWPWSTRIFDGADLYNLYPIYDWRTEDVWTAVGRNGWSYNRIYDGMYQAGKSIHESRICQPYGDDQRKGLDLFRKLEPETWAKVVNRVAGANYGNIYCGTALIGHRKVPLPAGHTWRSYTEFLLATMPRYEAEWYRRKFKVFLDWWAAHGYPEIPDEADPHLEAQKKMPSWRRLAKCLVKNDRLCKSLSFAQTKGQYAKYLQLREVYGE